MKESSIRKINKKEIEMKNKIEIICSENISLDKELENTIIDSVNAAFNHENKCGGVNVAIVDNEEIKRLNREFRDKDSVTDVLSFPAWEGNEILSTPDGFVGDIAISLPRAEEQANEYGHSLKREIAFLTIHGCLHILGYDHIKKEDELIMFPLQKKILEEMNISRE